MATDIYFACSVRGGQGDAEMYRQLIEHMKQYGTVVGEAKLAYLGDENHGSNASIYGEEMEWVRRADVIVAEVTTPSLGVGYEVAKAEEAGKPVLALFHDTGERRLSAMIAGSPYSSVVSYATVEDAMTAIDGFLRAFGTVTR